MEARASPIRMGPSVAAEPATEWWQQCGAGKTWPATALRPASLSPARLISGDDATLALEPLLGHSWQRWIEGAQQGRQQRARRRRRPEGVKVGDVGAHRGGGSSPLPVSTTTTTDASGAVASRSIATCSPLGNRY